MRTSTLFLKTLELLNSTREVFRLFRRTVIGDDRDRANRSGYSVSERVKANTVGVLYTRF